MSVVENNLKDLGLRIAKGGKHTANTKYLVYDDLLFMGGVEPYGPDGEPAFVGRLGREYSLEEGYKAARLVGLNMIDRIRAILGDTDKVDYIIKCMALINTADGFSDLSEVADGFTDVMTEMFGERGMHARTDFGATNLNNNVPVICDAIIRIRK